MTVSAPCGRPGAVAGYDVVHTHEEAGLLGPALARMADAPHVYDMGNDWADVLCNYGLGPDHPASRLAGALENAVIGRSDVVIAHFPLIADRVRSVGSTPVETVFNISLEAEPDPEPSLRPSGVAGRRRGPG